MLQQEISISFLPETTHSKSYLKGLRIPVWLLVSLIGNGTTEEQIFKQYPSLSSAELKAAIKFSNSTTVTK